MSDVQPVVPAVPFDDASVHVASAGEVAEESVRAAARHANTAAGRAPFPRAATPTASMTPVELAAARDALWAAVRAFAATLRRDGVPPERMLVRVKGAVRSGAPDGGDPLATHDLIGEAVRCGIAAYYGPT